LAQIAWMILVFEDLMKVLEAIGTCWKHVYIDEDVEI